MERSSSLSSFSEKEICIAAISSDLKPEIFRQNKILNYRSTVAQIAERAPHDLKVVGSNLTSGSYENVFSKLQSYCLLQHMTINSHGVWYDRMHIPL